MVALGRIFGMLRIRKKHRTETSQKMGTTHTHTHTHTHTVFWKRKEDHFVSVQTRDGGIGLEPGYCTPPISAHVMRAA